MILIPKLEEEIKEANKYDEVKIEKIKSQYIVFSIKK